MDNATAEAVARALCKQDNINPDLWVGHPNRYPAWHGYRPQARAALAALPQEPTQTGMPRPTRDEIGRTIFEASLASKKSGDPFWNEVADAILALFGAASHE